MKQCTTIGLGSKMSALALWAICQATVLAADDAACARASRLLKTLVQRGQYRAVLLACEYYSLQPGDARLKAEIEEAKRAAALSLAAQKRTQPRRVGPVFDYLRTRDGRVYRGKVLAKSAKRIMFRVIDGSGERIKAFEASQVASLARKSIPARELLEEEAEALLVKALEAFQANEPLKGLERLGRLLAEFSEARLLHNELRQREVFLRVAPGMVGQLGDTLADARARAVALAEARAEALAYACPDCGMTGKVDCPQCGGTGFARKTCPTCRGRKTQTCPSCQGAKGKTCKVCGGTGRRYKTRRKVQIGANGPQSYSYTVQVKCRSCGGDGWQNCRKCGGRGTVKCPECKGEGQIPTPCAKCKGEKKVPCLRCGGDGRLEEALVAAEPRRSAAPAEVRLIAGAEPAIELPARYAVASRLKWRQLRQLGPHKSTTTAVCFSPDGAYVATSSASGSIIIWGAQDGRQMRVLAGHSNGATALAFDARGALLASAGSDGMLKLWDARTGELRRTISVRQKTAPGEAGPAAEMLLEEPREGGFWAQSTVTRESPPAGVLAGRVSQVGFTRSGRQLYAAGLQGYGVWDVASGKQLYQSSLSQQTSSRYSYSEYESGGRVVRLSTKGDLAAVADASKRQVLLMEVQSGRTRQGLGPITNQVTALCFSPDGGTLAVAARQEGVKLWDTAKGRFIALLDLPNRLIQAMTFSPDGRLLALSDSMGYASARTDVWDVSRQRALWTINATGSAVAFSPDGQALAFAGRGAAVSVWSVAPAPDVLTLKTPGSRLSPVGFSPNGRILVTVSATQTLSFWDVPTGKHCFALARQSYGGSQMPMFSPKGDTFVTLDVQSKKGPAFVLKDARTGKRIRRLAHKTPKTAPAVNSRTFMYGYYEYRDVPSVASSSTRRFSRDGSRFAAPLSDKSICVWDVAQGREQHVLKGHTEQIVALDFSPDSKLLASAGADGLALLWDLQTGATRHKLQAHPRALRSVRFSPDGRRLATFGSEGVVKLWDVRDGRELQAWSAYPGRTASVVFSPDGRVLALPQARGILLTDAKSGREIATVGGQYGNLIPLRFVNAGREFVLRDPARGVSFWNVESGRQVRLVNGSFSQACLSPTGDLFLAQSNSGAVAVRVLSAHERRVRLSLRPKIQCPIVGLPGEARTSFGRYYASLWRASAAMKRYDLEKPVAGNPYFAQLFTREMLRESVLHMPLNQDKQEIAAMVAEVCRDKHGNSRLLESVERINDMPAESLLAGRGMTYLAAAYVLVKGDDAAVQAVVKASPEYATLFFADCLELATSHESWRPPIDAPAVMRELAASNRDAMALAQRTARAFAQAHGDNWMAAMVNVAAAAPGRVDMAYVNRGAALAARVAKAAGAELAGDFAALRAFVRQSLECGYYDAGLARAVGNRRLAAAMKVPVAINQAKSDLAMLEALTKLPQEAKQDIAWARAAGKVVARGAEAGDTNALMAGMRSLRSLIRSRDRREGLSAALRVARWNALLAEAFGDSQTRLMAHLDAFEVYRRLGDHPGAQRAIARAEQVGQQVADAAAKGRLLIAKALLESMAGRHQQAGELLNRALAVAEQSNNPLVECRYRVALALSLLARGRHAEAPAQAQAALRLATRKGQEVQRVTGFYIVGSSYAAEGAYSQAIKYCERSLQAAQAGGLAGWQWEALFKIGQCYQRMAAQSGPGGGQFQRLKAAEYFERALEAVETQRESLAAEEQKAFFSEDKAKLYEAIVETYLDLDRPADAVAAAERCKGMAFFDRFGPKALKRRTARLEQQKRMLDQAIAAVAAGQSAPRRGRTLIQRVYGRWPERQASQLALLRMQLGACKRALTRAQAPQQAKLANPHTTLLRLLPPRSIAIEYFLGEKLACAFVLRREGVRAVRLKAKPEELARLLDEFRSSAVESLSAEKLMSTAYREPLRQLYAALLSPFEEDLASADLVYIVPHGVLHYLPFHALIGPDDRYLIERTGVAYAFSINVLRHCRNCNMGNRASCFAVANPATGLDPLPATELEAEAVAAMFEEREVLRGADATEKRVKERVQSFDVLTFPTHGEMRWQDPTQSNLRFTPGEGEDGRWTVAEIFDTDLKANLVVLSACETGLSGGYAGRRTQADNFTGLTQAFLFAGASSVVGSLWQVADDSTVTLMTQFFKSWKQKRMNKAEALRQAQLALIRGEVELGTVRGPGGVIAIDAEAARQRSGYRLGSHPYFWAPFVLIGDYK